MISVRDLVEGQKVDSQDKYGDWWSATIQSVKLKAKKPYATLSWDEFPSSPPDKVYESAGKIRERKGKAFRKLESLQRRGLLAGRNSDGTYDVERIVAERKVGGRVRFKLRWRGYDASFDEWQPERHVSNDLIAAWRKGIRKGIGGGAKNSGKKKREAYVLSLPDESVERRALRQTDAQEDVDDFALDAVDMLKKAKKPMAVRKLHKKSGFSARRFRALHTYLRAALADGEEDRSEDQLVTPIISEKGAPRYVDSFKVWSPALISKVVGKANDIENGVGALNMRSEEKVIEIEPPLLVRYHRNEERSVARERIEITGHLSALLRDDEEPSGYRLSLDTENYKGYDANDRNGYRAAIAAALRKANAERSSGAVWKCGGATVATRLKQWVARVERGEEEEEEGEEGV